MNDLGFDVITVTPRHNQLCFITHIIAGVNIAKNHDGDIGFEFHRRQKKYT